MWNQKGFKNPSVLAVFLIISVVTGVSIYFSAGSDGEGGAGRSWIWNLGSSFMEPEQPSITSVLKRAATEDKTVIISILNEAWASPNSIIDLFLKSFAIGDGTKPLVKHLIIISIDQKAYIRCKSIHPYCFLLTVDSAIDFSAEKRFMSSDYLTLMWKRVDFLRKILELGYNFVFTDADIMWLRSPFKHFSLEADFTIACDRFFGNTSDLRNIANCGFFHARSHAPTIQFFRYWYSCRDKYKGQNEQAVFNMIKGDDFVRGLGLKIRFLDTAFFGGFCQPSRDFNEVCTMHANCCIGLDKKVNDLRLVLEDWGNFTNLSDDKKLGKFYWRIPSKC